MARGPDWRRLLGLDLSAGDLIPLLAVIALALQAFAARDETTPPRVIEPVKVTVDRNGETGIALCRRYDVPAELCAETEIEGNRATLLLDPDPARPETRAGE